DSGKDEKVNRVQDNEKKSRELPLAKRSQIIKNPPLLNVQKENKSYPHEVWPVEFRFVPLVNNIRYP
ncbi:MAG TPA: hypothetical protein PLJ13_17740, partial [Cyclobacteriaceae bacterium]|nr:hypothetical protein [Cyclobacteriaceae bacterium]